MPTRIAEFLAADWTIGAGGWTFDEHRLAACPDGGKVGRCEIHFPIEGRGCGRFRFACDVSVENASEAALLVDDVAFALDGREAALYSGRAEIAEDFAPARAVPGRFHRLSARTEGQEVVFSADGRDLFRWPRRAGRPVCRLGLRTYAPAEFRKLEIACEDMAGPTGRAPKPDFLVSCAVDFLDDMRRCPWTEQMIHEYCLRLKELGVRRLYWEDVHHFRSDYLTDPEVRALAEKDLTREPPGVWATMRQGWDEFAVAVKAAHEAGMEIYGLIKPFDWHYYDPDNEKGNWNREQQFLFCNQDKLMEPRPRPANFAPDEAPIGEIRLTARNDAPFAFPPDEIELWVSDDNAVFRRYAGPATAREYVERRAFRDWWTGAEEPPRLARALTFAGLNLTARHVALRCGRDSRSLRNRLHRLIEVFSSDGRPMEVTFATEFQGGTSTGEETSLSFDWDHNPGVPSARRAGRETIEQFVAVDGGRGWIGFTRGSMREPRRKWVALCPAYPEVRDLWLWIVRHSLDCGADGVDLRAPNGHIRCMSWARRNFNPPMREAYKRRYGVDPGMQPYDPPAFAHLAGDFYDAFVEEASALCRRREKKIQHHVFGDQDIGERDRPPMNIFPHWRKWIENGWLDGLTLKELFPRTPFFHEVMDAAARGGIETHYCRYLNSILRASWKPGALPASSVWKPVLRDIIRESRAEGCDGIILYEAAAFVSGTIKGRVESLLPDAAEVIRTAAR